MTDQVAQRIAEQMAQQSQENAFRNMLDRFLPQHPMVQELRIRVYAAEQDVEFQVALLQHMIPRLPDDLAKEMAGKVLDLGEEFTERMRVEALPRHPLLMHGGNPALTPFGEPLVGAVAEEGDIGCKATIITAGELGFSALDGLTFTGKDKADVIKQCSDALDGLLESVNAGNEKEEKGVIIQ